MVDEIQNIWIKRIKKAQEYHSKRWAKMGMTAQKIYENSDKEKPVYYPILANVVNIQQGSIITKTPDAVVSSTNELTYADDTIAQVYEKCLDHYADASDFGTQSICATRDFLVSALGSIRVDILEGEGIVFSHLSWKDLVLKPCKSWAGCSWIAIRHDISKSDLENDYDDIVINESYKKEHTHCWWEVWDKDTQKVYHVSESVYSSKNDDFSLKVEEPQFKRKGFFPIPEPILMDKKTDEFIPVVEFGKWEELHKIVNQLTERELALIENIRASHLFDKDAFDEAANFEEDEDNTYYPINGDKIRNQNGQLDLSKILIAKDNTATVNTLVNVQSTRDQVIAKIEKITGTSNEMQQGANELRETATSSRLRAGYGNARLDVKRRPVHRMNKACFALAAELMAQMDQAELVKLAGVQITPEELAEMEAYIEEGGLDSYTFDIETATSLAIDSQEEQEQKTKFIEAISGFSTNMMQAVQANMIPYSGYVSMLKMLSSNFPNARALNDEFDQMAHNNDMMQQLNGQIQELQGQLQAMSQENQAMQFELARRSETDMAKVAAEADLKEAQALKTDVETAQKAAETVVLPEMVQDDIIAVNSIQQPQIPVAYP